MTRVWEQLGELAAALFLPLHDGHLHVHPLHQGGQIEGDAPAAHHKDIADLGGVPAHQLKKAVQAQRRPDQIELVPHLGHERAVGDQDLLVPLGGAE